MKIVPLKIRQLDNFTTDGGHELVVLAAKIGKIRYCEFGAGMNVKSVAIRTAQAWRDKLIIFDKVFYKICSISFHRKVSSFSPPVQISDEQKYQAPALF